MLLTAACGQPAASPPDDPPESDLQAEAVEPITADVARAEPVGADVEEPLAGVTRFGIDLFGEVATDDANVVVSPASIAIAFGMARAGAAGQTAAEIDAVLGFPAEESTTHASFNALDRLLAAAAPAELDEPDSQTDGSEVGDERGGPPALAIANGVFPQVEYPIHEEYLALLAAQYGAGVVPVDFASDTATQRIDAWVQRQTRERIDKLFDNLDPNTRLVLANAVYLKADWVHPFAREPVTDQPFTLTSGEQVPVPTMAQLLESARHTAGDGWQAVELPYVGDTLAMWVIVPKPGITPRQVLTPESLTAIGDGLQPGAVDLRLPRWDFDTDVPLIPVLSALGMEAPFDPGAADFSGISDTGLWIGDAIHRATITVDEWGTEAAAVTGLAFADSGPPPPDATIHADHPFAFVIVDTQAHTPLFLGQVADPRN